MGHQHGVRTGAGVERRAVFASPPTGPNRVRHLDFSQFETVGGGTWRIAACTDYRSRVELGRHFAVTADQHDAIAAIEKLCPRPNA